MPHLRQIGKVPRRCGREHLRDRLLIFLRDGRVCVEEVAAHILAIPLARSLRPFMVLGRMVHDKVHAQADAFVMALLRQLSKVFHGPQIRFYLPEIRDRISSVRPAFRRIQKGHQMDIVHIALFQIRQFLLDALDIAGKIIDIHHHAQHIALPVPFSRRLAVCIQLFQLFISLIIILLHLVAEFREHIVVSIQFHVQPSQLVVVPFQALRKDPVRLFPGRLSLLRSLCLCSRSLLLIGLNSLLHLLLRCPCLFRCCLCLRRLLRRFRTDRYSPLSHFCCPLPCMRFL